MHLSIQSSPQAHRAEAPAAVSSAPKATAAEPTAAASQPATVVRFSQAALVAHAASRDADGDGDAK